MPKSKEFVGTSDSESGSDTEVQEMRYFLLQWFIFYTGDGITKFEGLSLIPVQVLWYWVIIQCSVLRFKSYCPEKGSTSVGHL